MGDPRTTQKLVKVEELVRWLWDGNQLTNEGIKPLRAPGCRLPGEGQLAWEARKLFNMLLGMSRFPDARTVGSY